MRPRRLIWIIVILVLLAVFANLPALPVKLNFNNWPIRIDRIGGNFPLKLGLDLQGGTELILQTDMSKIGPADRDQALESARRVIERRVNLFGVSESIVQSSRVGDQRRILVQLPGVSDASAAASLVGTTAQLDFRETPASLSARESEATKSGVPLIYFFKPTGLTGADLKSARVAYGQTNDISTQGSPQIEIQFSGEGAKKFAEITKRNVRKPLCIFLDNQPIRDGCPIVEQEILGGRAVITGKFTADQAKQLATQLNAGALPVPITIIGQRTIGPEFGQESVARSVAAGAIGLFTVMAFMIAYYGLLGMIADLVLIIYTLFVLAIFRTGLFLIPPVTLTLAGIAGFILSVGMAVDANILIFERMKEEKRWGKSAREALALGFKRAWSSIRDSNVSSLMTAGILYYVGSGLVKGFAVTLAIGVIVSMFTAIIVTRTFLALLMKK